MAFGEHKGLWLGLVVVVVVVGALVWLVLSGGPQTLVILFPEVGDLKKDDPVVWRGYTVGSVAKIDPLVDNQVGVTISLRQDYAAKITRGSRFTLKQASLFGLVGTNAIEVETASEYSLPYLDGEKVQGTSMARPTLVEAGKQKTIEYWEQAKKQAAALMEEYRNSPYRREVEDALAQLKTLAEQGAVQAKESVEQFRKDHQKELDAIVRKLEEARDWLRKKGDELGAKKLQAEIDKLIK